MIGDAKLVLLDPRQQRVYFALSQDLQNSNDRDRVNSVADKFVADVARVALGSDDGMQSRFPDVAFRRSPEQWVFFSTDVANLRLRTGGALKFKYPSAEFSISSGELKSYLTNASIRGGLRTVNTAHYAKELGGRRSIINWGALVTRPGEPSLTQLVKDLTNGIAEPERKIQRLVDFVAGEIKTDPVQTAGVTKRASEVLMTRKGTVPQKAVLLGTLLEQLPIDYILVYSGDDAWAAVPQGSFRSDNFLSPPLGPAIGRCSTSVRPVSSSDRPSHSAVPGFNSLVLAQRPQQDGRMYHRTTGMPVGNL